MRKVIYALLALFITCAFVSKASAQDTRPLCPLGHVLRTDCNNDRIEWRARQSQKLAEHRGREMETAAYNQAQRRMYGSYTDNIRFGDDPYSNMGTLDGRPVGRSGQWDRNGYWGSDYYGGYRYGIRGSSFYRDIYWKFSHAEFPDGPPGPPPETRAPKGYEWYCHRDVYYHYCGYTRDRGSIVVSILAVGVLIGAVAATH